MGDKMILIMCVLALALLVWCGIYCADYGIFNYVQKSQKESTWAIGTSDDAINLIKIIRADPKVKDGWLIVEGPNADSTIYESGRIQFKGVSFVYNSYKDYKKTTKWLKNNPYEGLKIEKNW